MKRWLAIDENRKQIPVDELLLLLEELDSNKVAIKGRNDYPAITHSLVANVITRSHQLLIS